MNDVTQNVTQTRHPTYFDLGTNLQRGFASNCSSLYQAMRQCMSGKDGRELPQQWWQESLACTRSLCACMNGWQAMADTQAEYLATTLLRGQHELGVQRERVGEQMLDLWLASLQQLEPPAAFALLDCLLSWPAQSGTAAAKTNTDKSPRPAPARARTGAGTVEEG